MVRDRDPTSIQELALMMRQAPTASRATIVQNVTSLESELLELMDLGWLCADVLFAAPPPAPNPSLARIQRWVTAAADRPASYNKRLRALATVLIMFVPAPCEPDPVIRIIGEVMQYAFNRHQIHPIDNIRGLELKGGYLEMLYKKELEEYCR